MMGRKNRKSAAAATKSVSSNSKTKLDVLTGWESAKNKGNLLYGQSKYDQAVEQYMFAISLLELDTSVKGLVILRYSLVAVNFAPLYLGKYCQ